MKSSSDTPKQRSILLRIDPQFHRQIRQASAILGKSMNTFIVESVEGSISAHARQGTFEEQIRALQTRDSKRDTSVQTLELVKAMPIRNEKHPS